MRFGTYHVFQCPPGRTPAQVIGEEIERTVLAEELGYRVKMQVIPRELLYIADELFFTGTAVEVTPVTSVDRIAIGDGSRGPITQAIQDAFFGIVTGKVADRHGWLAPVPQGSTAQRR